MDYLYSVWLGTPLWMWLAFLGIVTLLLALDLGVLHRKEREIGVGESLALSAGYIALGLSFGAWVWWQMGPTAGMNYVTGFVIEKSLAMDNVFVIAMIFAYFSVPRLYQHRVLFWGILGVIVLRAIMIGFGAALVSQFSGCSTFLRLSSYSPASRCGARSAKNMTSAKLRFSRGCAAGLGSPRRCMVSASG